ncbi:hypothetical protein [Parasutterella excrementihominis]|uniref:hypothetical protein n=1 Tax=Parasutterella excrementihominis TaxID=487175 RepID=UPI0030779C32
MNFEKIKAAEVVKGEKLGHPDDTYGGKGLIGSEIKVSIEGEGFEVSFTAADAVFLDRAARVAEAILGPEGRERVRRR